MPALDHSPAWRIALACLFVAIGGCAAQDVRNPADPLEPTNRQAFAFNDAVDRRVLRPTAKAYQRITPDWFRTGVGNFFDNMSSPATVVNSLLQGKPVDAGQETLRFLLNTTLGIGGVLDPATAAELPRHDEDFGQTLGSWGVPSGPFLMIPLLGPSTVRDFPSDFVDRFMRPLFWFDLGNARWGALALDIVNTRASFLSLDATLQRAFDPYAFMRDAFLQRRLFQVHDGNPPEQPFSDPLEDPLEDPSNEAGDDPGAGPIGGVSAEPTSGAFAEPAGGAGRSDSGAETDPAPAEPDDAVGPAQVPPAAVTPRPFETARSQSAG